MDSVVINKIKDAARQMINDIDELCGLGEFIRQYTHPEEGYDWREHRDVYSEFVKTLPDHIGYASGACRLILWDKDDESFVCKINIATNKVNYNRAEYETYREAVARGCAEHFAWCDHLMSYKLDNINEADISVMEFADIDYEQNSDDAFNYVYESYCKENNLEESHDALDQFNDEFDGWEWDDDEAMFDIARFEWGNSEVHTVSTLLDDFGITDCHAGNWGRRCSDTAFILTDYAGFGHQAGLAYFEREGM